MKPKRIIRLLEYLFTVWLIITLNFALPRMMPGDPFTLLSTEQGEVLSFSAEQRQYYLDYYGLNRPAGEQYLAYVVSLLQGDLGRSLYYNEPVGNIVLHRLGWTAFLVISAVLLSAFLGTILGTLSAWFRDKWLDKGLFALLIILSEVPAFLLGLVLLLIFAAALGWFPLSGAMTHFGEYASFWHKLGDILNHAFLPILALTLVNLGGMYLLARNSASTVLEKEFILTAQAKGLPRARILWHHVLRNVLLPIVTRVFLGLGALVGGAILVENVFAYPGLGYLMREAVMVRDYPLIQGIFLVVTLCVLLANWLADLIYEKIDPRLSSQNVAPEGCS